MVYTVPTLRDVTSSTALLSRGHSPRGCFQSMSNTNPHLLRGPPTPLSPIANQGQSSAKSTYGIYVSTHLATSKDHRLDVATKKHTRPTPDIQSRTRSSAIDRHCIHCTLAAKYNPSSYASRDCHRQRPRRLYRTVTPSPSSTVTTLHDGVELNSTTPKAIDYETFTAFNP